jgi:hypothetical protein
MGGRRALPCNDQRVPYDALVSRDQAPSCVREGVGATQVAKTRNGRLAGSVAKGRRRRESQGKVWPTRLLRAAVKAAGNDSAGPGARQRGAPVARHPIPQRGRTV